ncbi:hypothetical protein [Pontibacter virosus]|uniref:Uncharacterized protein n=1 Tax=Pontibacter virosus TaxID=1765052 RepID=A0A2U1AS60_9BACT|nr:hypothetical protein [Pontibacter virosus]PVY39269.1 hypothetical protein C8E01_11268 [Pontibacter virosus]
MKKSFYLFLAAGLFTFASCDSPADERADQVEDAAEEQADQIEEAGEREADRIEDGDTTIVQ